MQFHDRNEAAGLLAEKLMHYRGTHPLILAIPRGAVPMGKIIANALDGELDVVLAAKIPAPDNPEFAIGTVAENGWMQLAEWADEVGATPVYIENQKADLLAKLHQRRMAYSALKPSIEPRHRVVIVVDDGLATGMTMIGALDALRKTEPQKLVIAVPIASQRALAEVERHADEVICLSSPSHFRAVGQYYEDFSQVSDAEVAQILGDESTGVSGFRAGAMPAPDAPRR